MEAESVENPYWCRGRDAQIPAVPRRCKQLPVRLRPLAFVNIERLLNRRTRTLRPVHNFPTPGVPVSAISWVTDWPGRCTMNPSDTTWD
jgi:hypothetical protein